MRVNTERPNGWITYDNETVMNTDGGVHHGASATQNLRVMAEDTVHAIVPLDRAIMWTIDVAKAKGPGWAILAFIGGLLLDALELIFLPLMLVKHFIDILAHAFAALANRFRGQRDGIAEQPAPLDIQTLPSFVRQWTGESLHEHAVRHERGLVTPLFQGVSVGAPRHK